MKHEKNQAARQVHEKTNIVSQRNQFCQLETIFKLNLPFRKLGVYEHTSYLPPNTSYLTSSYLLLVPPNTSYLTSSYLLLVPPHTSYLYLLIPITYLLIPLTCTSSYLLLTSSYLLLTSSYLLLTSSKSIRVSQRLRRQ